MNRKLGTLLRATLFALPLALPGVALAQSAGGSSSGSVGGTDSTSTRDSASSTKSTIDTKPGLASDTPGDTAAPSSTGTTGMGSDKGLDTKSSDSGKAGSSDTTTIEERSIKRHQSSKQGGAAETGSSQPVNSDPGSAPTSRDKSLDKQ